jgi:hypothetical protein
MDYISSAEQTQLEALVQTDSFVKETIDQCDRILASRTFGRVQKEARAFLDFIVKKRLLGGHDEIKEVIIAIHVFNESPDYNPAESTKIRVAAGNLRERLSRYYKEEGMNDPIEILIPIGTYVPQIRDRRVSIAVRLFENWNPDGAQGYLCAAMVDEIVHQLTQSRNIQAGRVIAFDTCEGFSFGLCGSLECRADVLRLNISFSDLGCKQVVSNGSIEGPRHDLIKLAGAVANAIVVAFQLKTRFSKDLKLLLPGPTSNGI